MSKKNAARKPSEALLERIPDLQERERRRQGVALARLRLEVAQTVHHLREQQGLTQTDLARRVGTRQPNISRLERGEATGVPSLDLLGRVADALGGELQVRIVRKSPCGAPKRRGGTSRQKGKNTRR